MDPYDRFEQFVTASQRIAGLARAGHYLLVATVVVVFAGFAVNLRPHLSELKGLLGELDGLDHRRVALEADRDRLKRDDQSLATGDPEILEYHERNKLPRRARDLERLIEIPPDLQLRIEELGRED